jgi:hypothetical protein
VDPRQRHIAFLGSTSIDGSDRRRFWFEVTERLDQLSRVTPEDRKRIIASIVKRLGEAPPTRAQLEKFKRDRALLMM